MDPAELATFLLPPGLEAVLKAYMGLEVALSLADKLQTAATLDGQGSLWGMVYKPKPSSTMMALSKLNGCTIDAAARK